MKRKKKAGIVLLLLLLCMSLPMTAGAKPKDVTSKYRFKVTMMLGDLDWYLGRSSRNEKFVFNDYAKTTMVCMLHNVYGQKVSTAKKRCKSDLKLYFGSNAKFKLKKYVRYDVDRQLRYWYKNKGGKVIYTGGDYGCDFPAGKVSKILQLSPKKFVVTYKEYLKNDEDETKYYLRTYQITLQKAKNRNGFIITNIR